MWNYEIEVKDNNCTQKQKYIITSVRISLREIKDGLSWKAKRRKIRTLVTHSCVYSRMRDIPRWASFAVTQQQHAVQWTKDVFCKIPKTRGNQKYVYAGALFCRTVFCVSCKFTPFSFQGIDSKASKVAGSFLPFLIPSCKRHSLQGRGKSKQKLCQS